MANTRSASKRKRQTDQRTVLNRSVLTGLKGQQKRLTAAIASGDKTKAQAELDGLASRLDKAAKRGIVHQNLANRRKSRAAKIVAGIGAGKADAGIVEAGAGQ
jgi:small subunit ribosomal protein S20